MLCLLRKMPPHLLARRRVENQRGRVKAGKANKHENKEKDTNALSRAPICTVYERKGVHSAKNNKTTIQS